MENTIWKALRLILPLSKYQKRKFDKVSPFLEQQESKRVKRMLKLKEMSIKEEEWKLGSGIISKRKMFTAEAEDIDEDVEKFIQNINKDIKEGIYADAFKEYAKKAGEDIPATIATNIMGMEMIKKAIGIQLFAKERFHILLLGDPGTGKTDLVRSASDLSPISSFGLGSGVSGVGLAVAKVGKQIKKGLLGQAHKGLCCIDELNLMKKEDRAALYNAMEKGFVSLDKGGAHEVFPAEVKLLATANPIGDKFRGTNIDYIRRHLPFDAALLSRFHLVFVIKRPSKKEFLEITKKIIADGNKHQEQDLEFFKQYIAHALTLKVEFPKKYEQMILDFVEDIREKEKKFIIEISPRTIIGVVNMAKARARMSLRKEVSQDDVREVLDIMKYTLEVEDALKEK
jgi:replicative DNA helicase Mcm